MHRIDRLMAILVLLQTKRVLTAGEIASRFDVSLRTVYRDIRSLESAGVPVGSEPGLGYYLAEGYRLPPVMLTGEEATALLTAGKFMGSFTGPPLARHFDSAMDKIRAVLREGDKDSLERLEDRIAVFSPASEPGDGGPITDIQAALSARKAMTIQYRSPGQSPGNPGGRTPGPGFLRGVLASHRLLPASAGIQKFPCRPHRVRRRGRIIRRLPPRLRRRNTEGDAAWQASPSCRAPLPKGRGL